MGGSVGKDFAGGVVVQNLSVIAAEHNQNGANRQFDFACRLATLIHACNSSGETACK
jgi:hypothetical protein